MDHTAHNVMPADAKMQHSTAKTCLKWLALGTALAAGAVIVSPYVLPLVGIGEGKDIVNIMTTLHSNPAVAGEGLAGVINKGLAAVPLMGNMLANGGMAAALTSGALGLGGMILGNYVGKRENGKHFIKWGKVISTTALAASALIALPTALTGITAGISFLAALYDTELGSTALTFLAKTVGFANSESLSAAGLSTASIALPHLLTCGAGSLPALLSFGMHGTKSSDTPKAGDPLPTGAVSASIRLAKPTSAGETVQGIVTLTDAGGSPLTLDRLKPVHTKKLHFFVVDSSLKDYHHIHPTPTDMPGQYAFSFTPKTSGTYSGWSDITLREDGKNYRLKTDMPAEQHRNIPASILMNSRAEAKNAGLTFEWKTDKPLAKDASSMVEITVKDSAGQPVTDLEPMLGAYAHLVGFAADGKTIIHSHPMGAEPADETSRSGPVLRFHMKPEAAGNTQFYLQVKENGQDIYAPFGQMIRQPEKVVGQFARLNREQGAGMGLA